MADHQVAAAADHLEVFEDAGHAVGTAEDFGAGFDPAVTVVQAIVPALEQDVCVDAACATARAGARQELLAFVHSRLRLSNEYVVEVLLS